MIFTTVGRVNSCHKAFRVRNLTGAKLLINWPPLPKNAMQFATAAEIMQLSNVFKVSISLVSKPIIVVILYWKNNSILFRK